MNHPRAAGRRLRTPILLALILAVTLTAGGCAYERPWTFGVTRWSFQDGGFRSSGGSGELLLVVLGVIVGLDLLFLPAAIFHDIWLSTHDYPEEPNRVECE